MKGKSSNISQELKERLEHRQQVIHAVYNEKVNIQVRA